MIALIQPLLPLLVALQDGEEAAPPEGGNQFWVLLIALFAVFYFVMILPERKSRRQREEMLGGMKKGDKVMTSSGMYATIAMLSDDVVTLQVADGVRVRFSRAAIQSVLTEPAEEEKADE
ncbi:MAG: preprotein translocase subunit YajC [Planctomycetota bacterium]